MKDFTGSLAKPREIALYAHLTIDNFFAVFELHYSSRDAQYTPLPDGERRETPFEGYVRISQPIKVDFVAINNDDVIRNAIESLNEQERKAVAELNKTLAQIRERKNQLLALTHQSAATEVGGFAVSDCERCKQLDQVHDEQCPDHPDHDPTPWCSGCGARRKQDCHCGPIADNE